MWFRSFRHLQRTIGNGHVVPMWVTITPLTRSWTSKAHWWLSCPHSRGTNSVNILPSSWMVCCVAMSLFTGFAVIVAILKGLEKSIQKWSLLRFTQMCPQIASPKWFPTVSSRRKCWRVFDLKVFLPRCIYSCLHRSTPPLDMNVFWNSQ